MQLVKDRESVSARCWVTGERSSGKVGGPRVSNFTSGMRPVDIGFIGLGNMGQPNGAAEGAPADRCRAVLNQWELTHAEFGGDSDFIVQLIERRAGATVGKKS